MKVSFTTYLFDFIKPSGTPIFLIIIHFHVLKIFLSKVINHVICQDQPQSHAVDVVYKGSLELYEHMILFCWTENPARSRGGIGFKNAL